MALKPWYTLVFPRDDLKAGQPADAAEFAVNLEGVRLGTAPDYYRDPQEFFERTYLTQTLKQLAGEVARRLSGEVTQTSAVFNLATQFGGGKTHSLTLLYHLAQYGEEAANWSGVHEILRESRLNHFPQAATAIFVGEKFDSLTGRGGNDGTPLRRTPWGEIAYQLGGEEYLAVVAQHEDKGVAPAGDVIYQMLPADRPVLILVDELMGYISRNRHNGLGSQTYHFLQSLSEVVRERRGAVLAVSIPASELEMTADDMADYSRLDKMLERLGKRMVMSAEHETAEIIRRRLFGWRGLDKDAKKVIGAYADWVTDHRQLLPQDFPIDYAQDAFAATYPFHPTVLSVFERKWQTLPNFQRTRGVLRMLALWVAHAYQTGYSQKSGELMIDLGSAPLHDPLFREAMLGQLGEDRLTPVIATDIVGREDSHAVRLDEDSTYTLRQARLHQRVATAIFFESNGGQTAGQERAEATIPEIRMAMAEPDLEIGNLETVLDGLTATCYYLQVERNRYRFSLKENLNKILAGRLGSISSSRVDERIQAEVQNVFAKDRDIPIEAPIYFPQRSNDIPDRPAITLIVMSPDDEINDQQTQHKITRWHVENGSETRRYKNALIWCVPDKTLSLRDAARQVLAWEDIQDEYAHRDDLDRTIQRQISENLGKSQRDLRETIWRAYKNLVMWGMDGQLKQVDLGRVHSSAASSIIALIINHLQSNDDVTPSVGASSLVRNWTGNELWSTKAVRDAFFMSPQFPRLLRPESIRETIARGVNDGLIAYVSVTSDGGHVIPFNLQRSLSAADIDISDSMYILRAEVAQAYQRQTETAQEELIEESNSFISTMSPASDPLPVKASEPAPAPISVTPYKTFTWEGEITSQQWTIFYNRVLSRFVSGKVLRINLRVAVSPDGGISGHKLDEVKTALHELGLSNDIQFE